MNGLSDHRHIVLLIYKQIIGCLTPEEEGELDEWRKADEWNEALFRRLTDVSFLEREFRRLNVVDPARPQADMQARIRQGAAPPPGAAGGTGGRHGGGSHALHRLFRARTPAS